MSTFLLICNMQNIGEGRSDVTADMPGSDLPLRGLYTNCTTSLGSNHCFQAIGTYRNWHYQIPHPQKNKK